MSKFRFDNLEKKPILNFLQKLQIAANILQNAFTEQIKSTMTLRTFYGYDYNTSIIIMAQMSDSHHYLRHLSWLHWC